MKFQIHLPVSTYANLCKLAFKEHRPPRYQAEAIIDEAVARAVEAGVIAATLQGDELELGKRNRGLVRDDQQ